MTSKATKYSREFLRELLVPLINQWGRDEVMSAIYDLDQLKSGGRSQPKVAFKESQDLSDRKKSQSQRPNAVMIVERANVPREKRMLLINIASQFEHKTFLPTVSDVRNFLEMRGQDARSIKQRPEAFRKILKAIIDMPDESLERLSKSIRHSGPLQLGPLSDAIKAASASVRGSRGEQKPEVEEGSQEPDKPHVEDIGSIIPERNMQAPNDKGPLRGVADEEAISGTKAGKKEPESLSGEMEEPAKNKKE
jgi:hypothetical protein